MSKKKHTTLRRQILDIAFALGIIALSAEMIAMTLLGGSLQASVYNPLPLRHNTQLENRFTRQIDTTSVKAPTPRTFTACERRATMVMNIRRRNQVLALCHAREQQR
jgi:hypothetical protein